jgi:hypothetical protein
MEPGKDVKNDSCAVTHGAGPEQDAAAVPLPDRRRNGRGRIRSYTYFLITIWTLVIAISLGWNLYLARQEIRAMALTTARINYDKDLLYRRWATLHGGVYVPVTPDTPPTPTSPICRSGT